MSLPAASLVLSDDDREELGRLAAFAAFDIADGTVISELRAAGAATRSS